MPGRDNGHTAELRRCAGSLSGRSDRHATELCDARGSSIAHGSGCASVPCWHDRHTAKLQDESAGDMSGRHDGHAAELQGEPTGDLSRRHDGHTAELQGEPAGDLSGRNDGHAAELQGESAGEMSCRYDGHAAELPGEPAADMSRRYDGNATELQGASAAAAESAGAPELRAAEEAQPGWSMRVMCD